MKACLKTFADNNSVWFKLCNLPVIGLKTLWEKDKVLVTCIFSLAVFGEKPRYCYSLGVVIGVLQKL